jgi:hypothetical protein
MKKQANIPAPLKGTPLKPEILVRPTGAVPSEKVETIAVEAEVMGSQMLGPSAPKTPMSIMVSQVRKDTGLMFSGLGVLVKDLSEHIALRGYAGERVNKFRVKYSELLELDRLYFEAYQPQVYKTLDSTGLPSNFALNADGHRYDVTALNPASGKEGKLGDEWLRRLGWSFYRSYSPSFEPIFSAIKAEAKSNLSNNDKIVKLAERYVAQNGMDEDTWWFPYVLYMSGLTVHINMFK